MESNNVRLSCIAFCSRKQRYNTYSFGHTVDVSPTQHVMGYIFSAKTGENEQNKAKEPGHFGVRTSSSQVTRMHFFLKKVDDLL